MRGLSHLFFSKCPGYCHHIGKQKWPQCAIHASPLSCQVPSPIIIRRLEWQNEIWKVTTHKNVAKSDHLCCWCPDILFCQWFWNSCQTDNGLRLGFIISLLPDIHDLQCHLVCGLLLRRRECPIAITWYELFERFGMLSNGESSPSIIIILYMKNRKLCYCLTCLWAYGCGLFMLIRSVLFQTWVSKMSVIINRPQLHKKTCILTTSLMKSTTIYTKK